MRRISKKYIHQGCAQLGFSLLQSTKLITNSVRKLIINPYLQELGHFYLRKKMFSKIFNIFFIHFIRSKGFQQTECGISIKIPTIIVIRNHWPFLQGREHQPIGMLFFIQNVIFRNKFLTTLISREKKKSPNRMLKFFAKPN